MICLYFYSAGKALKLENVVLVKGNKFSHRTRDYTHKDMILRRGQKFTIDIEFNRKISWEYDEVTLQFTFGKNYDDFNFFILLLK